MAEQTENIVGMRKKLKAQAEHVRRLEQRIRELKQTAPQPGQEPFWYAVVSEQAPTINSAIKRLDVAQEFADSKRERWPDTRVVPLYTAPQPEQSGLVEALDSILSNLDENLPGCFTLESRGDFDAAAAIEQAHAALAAVTAERDRLLAALSAPDTITAEPAGDYDNLRKQFLSLRMLANSNAKMVHHWRAQCGRETRETLLANAASVNAERDTNSMLTDALETAERERDQLRAEVEGLRKERDRFLAEVKSLLDAITAMAAKEA